MTNKIKIEVEFDFENALERSEADPLAAADELRGAFKKGRGGYYRTMREAMATSCAIFQNLRPNEEDWHSFLGKSQEVETPFNPRENSDLAAVVFYVFPHVSYTQGIKYAAGLQLLIDERIEPSDMPAMIKKRRGIDNLYMEATAKKRGKTGASNAAHGGSTKSSKRRKPGADDASPPGTTEDDDVPGEWGDWEPDAEEGDEVGDDPSAVRATAKAKKEAGRVAGKLARIAVENDSEWILCEIDHPLFKRIMKTTKSDAFELRVENLGPTKGLVRFRIAGSSL